MQLTEKAKLFRSEQGSVVVYVDGFFEVFFSPDGRTFFELYRCGYEGSSEKHTFSFENPHTNEKGSIHREKDLLELGGKTYLKVVPERYQDIYVVPLPTIRVPEYLFQAPDGQYLYVSADKYRFSYDSFKLFIGTKTLNAVPVKRVSRYRDGGTTVIETAEGVLHSPTPFRPEMRATWQKNQELTTLDPAQFDIWETIDTVSISKRR